MIGFALGIYYCFIRLQPIEKCTPVNSSVGHWDSPYCSNNACDEGPNLDHYSVGCTYTVDNAVEGNWILHTVLPQCSNIMYDYPVLYIFSTSGSSYF